MSVVPRLCVILALPLGLALGCSAPPAEEPPPDEAPAAEEAGEAGPLFDGASFAGWEGNEQLFRVEDGAVVAGSLTEAIPHNEFLCTTAEYGDFELRLEARSSREDANGGIQFRSRRAPDSTEVIGYQADIGLLGGDEPRNIWGALYDESRRRELLAVGNQEGLAEVFRPGEWNDYVIQARGPRIGIWINGFQTVDYTEADADIEARGLICLQVHAGPPAEIHYRGLEIEALEEATPE
jgi:hypothetical protein